MFKLAYLTINRREGDLISMLLNPLRANPTKWQSLIEYNKIRSDESLLIYLMEQDRNNMLNKVLVHKDCRRNYTNPLRKKRNKEI